MKLHPYSRGRVPFRSRRVGRLLAALLALATVLVTVAACKSTSTDGAAGPSTVASSGGSGATAGSDTGSRGAHSGDTAAGSATRGSATTGGPVTVPAKPGPTRGTATPGPSGQTSRPAGSSGSGEPGSGAGSSLSPTTPTTPAEPEPVARVSASPAFGSTGVSVLAPITVTVADGTIGDLTLTNPAGKKIKGEVSADGHSWRLGEVLGYGKTYTASGTAIGTDGRRVPIKGTFTTVTPAGTVNARVNIGDGAVVGVAAPIMVTFGGVAPADRALIEKHVSVTTEPKVIGAWGWINHDGGVWGLDFRTKDFWPAGTRVHVTVDVYGLDFGGGRYGAADVTSDFTIGRNQVVYADVNSYKLVVKRDGKVTATYPASYGRGTDYNTTTRSGIHVINDFFTLKLMSNPRYGYRNYPAKWAVRISDNGEFIHANDGTVGEQGSTNVSHGCVNLSTANAKEFYDSSLYGDPVVITGTTVQLSPSDGDIFDWAIPWSEWVTLSAVR